MIFIAIGTLLSISEGYCSLVTAIALVVKRIENVHPSRLNDVKSVVVVRSVYQSI